MKNPDQRRPELSPGHAYARATTAARRLGPSRRLAARNSLYRELSGSLISASKQLFFLYPCCFVLVIIVSFVHAQGLALAAKAVFTIGLLMGFLAIFGVEFNRLASTTGRADSV